MQHLVLLSTIQYKKMYHQNSDLVIIREYPTSQPFSNPICKSTYNSLPKIYGGKHKHQLLHINDLLKQPLSRYYTRQCCNTQPSEKPSRLSINKHRKINVSSMFDKPKISSVNQQKSTKCVTVAQQKGTQLRSIKERKRMNVKINNIKRRLPRLKQFQMDDNQTHHKIFRTSKAKQTSPDSNLSRLINRNYSPNNNSSDHDYPCGLSKANSSEFNESVNHKQNSFKSAENKASYFRYLQNGTQSQKNNRMQTSSNLDNISLSAKALRNEIECTLFHKYNKNQSNNQKRSIQKSILSNGLFKIPQEDQYKSYIKNYKPLNEEFNLKKLVASQHFQIIPNNEQNKVYFGEMKEEKKHGLGIFLTEKSVFQGKYKNDVKTEGCEKNIDGVYTGHFQNGKRNGKGKFVWFNGEVFDGQWVDGKKHGFGVWKTPKGDYYQGTWQKNRQSGQGIHFHKNGSKYKGTFTNGLKSGQGRQEFPNKDTYEGQYLEGKPNGFGKYIWSNGDIYLGNFKRGSRDGKGKLAKKGGQIYEGQFQNDLKHGPGKQRYPSGEYFQGEYHLGHKSKGTLYGKKGKVVDITE